VGGSPDGKITMKKLIALAVSLGAIAGLPLVSAATSQPTVEVEGTQFRVTATDGRVLTGQDLVGSILTIGDPAGNRMTVRIDGVQADPEDPSGETTLYTLMVKDPTAGTWRNICKPGPDGLSMGFPLSGTWTTTGEHIRSDRAFILTCTAGAIGKCIRMGYKPWKTASDGTSLWLYHQACTRMVRADYCGDGISRTRNGTPINVYDRLGMQRLDPMPTMRFEAAWAPDGAVVVNRTRLPEVASLIEVLRACPDRLAHRIGTEARAINSADALIFNHSGELAVSDRNERARSAKSLIEASGEDSLPP
jgi:hypothetical protein